LQYLFTSLDEVLAFVAFAEQLCIQGGSNGGLLVLAVALQRPKLFRAVVSQVRTGKASHLIPWCA
jgi:prolyl oligopeptidase PreP (S9A serine peptidase family)